MDKKPRALILASVASMIDQFNMQNIQLLLDNGYEVDVIANFEEPGNISLERSEDLQDELHNIGVSTYHIEIPRSLGKIKNIISSYNKIKKLYKEREYQIIHSHSPIGGVISRIAARHIRLNGCRVIYTAHGFHFYKGSPKKNWIVFYPIEKICSRFTDVIITINEEDYRLAIDKFYSQKVKRIPGIGVNTERFKPTFDSIANECKRKEIEVPYDSYLVLSVGELNDNKNHQLVLRAIANSGKKEIHYVIVGIGKNRKKLEQLAETLQIKNRVHFLGYRTDILELNNCADLFAFPSIREGLGMAALEALACGTPVIGMDTRGINEYVIDGKTGYLFNNNVDSCKKALLKSVGKKQEMMKACIEIAQSYSSKETEKIMKDVYNLK